MGPQNAEHNNSQSWLIKKSCCITARIAHTSTIIVFETVGNFETVGTMSSSSLPTTRVCFKNLPKKATTESLKKHLDSCGTWNITDVKVVKRRDGVSRRFAFVGFHTHEDALRAINFFDKTFFNTSRLKVEKALPVGDKHLPRAWSRHTAGTTAYNKRHGIVKNQSDGIVSGKPKKESKHDNESDKKEGDRSKFKEFLEIMQPRSKGNKWSNDGVVAKNSVEISASATNETKSDGSSSDEEYEDLDATASKVGSLDAKEEKSIKEKKKKKRKGEKRKGEKRKEKKKESLGSATDDKQMSDMDYLMTKVSKKDDVGSDNDSSSDSSSSSSDSSSDSDTSDESSSTSSGSDDDSDDEGNNTVEDADKNKDKSDESVEETGRLFVRNIPFSTTEDELRQIFEPYGALTEVHIPNDNNQRSKGFGYVTFVVPECAVLAMSSLDGNIFQGRLLHILPGRRAIEPDHDDDNIEEGGTSGYKKKREKNAKDTADDDSNWNPVYIRVDTAVTALANQFNMKKGEILDSQANNMAVRVALGEAHVLAETKKFLADNGVSTDALDDAAKGLKVKRSKCTILVKNLPADTDVPELRQLFSKHGEVSRFVVPPTKVMALVEYVDKLKAKRAFRGLAYKRYKRVPLYLEWAPENSFVSKSGTVSKVELMDNGGTGEAHGNDKTRPDSSLSDSSSIGTSNSIFVKNINFDTTESTLKKHFESVVSVRSVRIPRKGAKKELSMGFGFVEFASIKDAQKAMKRLQHTNIDGHTIELKLSMQGTNSNKSVKGGNKRKVLQISNATGTKLLVKNLAFEATRNDLRELFGAFGQIKSVRIPRKFDGGTRGFGFVDFLTREEATNCLNALENAHLYGRRLVIDWAQETEYDEVDEDDQEDVDMKNNRKKKKMV